MATYGFYYNGQHSDAFNVTAMNTITGIAPPVIGKTISISKRPGALYNRTDLGPRWIKVTVAITGTSNTDLWTQIEQISGWLNPANGPQPLIFDNRPNRTFYAVLDEGGGGGSGSQSTDIEQLVTLGQGTLTFMCADPFAYGEPHSQGIDAPTGTFSRNSVANDPNTLASVALGVPRFAPGKFGNGVFIEEGTTNIVFNSDFETTTSTATVFADALTSYAGSAVPAPWTLQAGSFTFSASGATSGAGFSHMTAGNAQWKPIVGSDGTTKLAVKVSATITTPSPISGDNGWLSLYTDENNRYNVYINGTGIAITKVVAGAASVTLVSSTSFTPQPGTTYTLTLQIDSSGNLTATITPSGGSTTTITVTDTSLTGGFQIGVGGDAGTVISNASVIAPWADGWAIGGDSRVAWALNGMNPISGKYGMSGVGVANVTGYTYSNITVSPSTAYTVSYYVETQNVGAKGVQVTANLNGALAYNPVLTGTTATSRYSATATSQSSGAHNVTLAIYDSGNVTFDAIQLEQKAYATSYLRNDSTSATATRSAETLEYPASLISAAQGSIGFWVTPSLLNPPTSDELVALSAFQTTNANGKYWLGWNGHGWGCADLNLIASTANVPYTVGTPVHLCATWAGSTMSVYVEGVRLGSGNLLSGFAISDAIRVGHFVGGVLQIGGNIDELCIFNRVLSDAEVTSLYQATSATPPVTDGLTGLYPFDSDVANSPQPVDVQGTAETLPVVTANFTSPSTNYQVTHVETGNLANILHDFVAGDELVIDCTKNSVTINGANALTDLDIASDFFQLAAGSNTFTVQSPGDAITGLAYTERWL